MPVNQSSHEKDSKAFILWIKVGKEVEFAKYAAITNVWKFFQWNIVNQPVVYIAWIIFQKIIEQFGKCRHFVWFLQGEYFLTGDYVWCARLITAHFKIGTDSDVAVRRYSDIVREAVKKNKIYINVPNSNWEFGDPIWGQEVPNS